MRLRPPLPHLLFNPPLPIYLHPQLSPHRAFLTHAPQTLTATRTLPFPAASVFALIADIPSYPLFLPYCLSARVLATALADPQDHPDARYHIPWPRVAELCVGWGPVEESFRSRVFCMPNRVLEAVAVEDKTEIPGGGGGGHYGDGAEEKEGKEGLFRSLRARWTLSEAGGEQSGLEGGTSEPRRVSTEVGLEIEVQFASATYAALSQAVLPKVAGVMIDAFVTRAGEVLGKENGLGEIGGNGVRGVS